MSLLSVKNIWVQYGTFVALQDFSIDIEKGITVAIIGSNGAGKSTLLRTISGLIKPVRGEIHFDGSRIDNLSCHEIVQLGMAHCPEGRKIFAGLTVSENLNLGAYIRKDREKIIKDLKKIYDLFPILWERRAQKAGRLSGGEQQMLAIGRALMRNLKLFLLDEPSLGLGPKVINEIGKVLKRARLDGITIVLVEQNCVFAFGQADEVYVLEQGKIEIKGQATEVQKNQHVREAYLGM
jgi:branched-chain amino acid transport system ATP-binding protein